jgi:hypothetical protein
MYTHHELKFFAKSEANYGKHSLELVIWVIDASRRLSRAKTGSGRQMNIRGKQIWSVWREAEGSA